MNTALKSGNDNEYRALRERAQAIKGEITTRKQLLKELRDQSNALEAEATTEDGTGDGGGLKRNPCFVAFAHP